MPLYKITYTDPESGELVTETKEFTATEGVLAEEWAEDYAYAKADKNLRGLSIREVAA